MKTLKIDYSYSLVFLLAFLIIFDYTSVFLPAVLAALIHEMGHLFAILLFKGKVYGLAFGISGVKIDYDSSGFTYLKDIACLISGPLAGILAALFGSSLELTLFSGISFSLSVFNLLPVRPLDGGKIIHSITMQVFSPYTAEIICRSTEISVLILLSVLSAYLAVISGGNLTLLFTTLILIICYCKDR